VARRLVATAAAGGLVATAALVSPRWSEDIGRDLVVPDLWLAGLFDRLGDFWNGQPLAMQILLTIALAAVVVLAGASFTTAFFVAGAAAYLLDHAHGAATFIRSPRAAVTNYLTTATPGGILLDMGEAALTFVPAGVGSAAGTAAGVLLRPRGVAYAFSATEAKVIRNALDEDEYTLAKAIAREWGGEFIGILRKNEPAIDGYLGGVPVSLKVLHGTSFTTLLRRAIEAEKSAFEHNYRGVVLFIDVGNMPVKRMLDFASKGRLAEIPGRGIIKEIWAKTVDGWVLLPGAMR
jgi:hypothetical protein